MTHISTQDCLGCPLLQSVLGAYDELVIDVDGSEAGDDQASPSYSKHEMLRAFAPGNSLLVSYRR